MSFTFSQPSTFWNGSPQAVPVPPPAGFSGQAFAVPVNIQWDGINPTQLVGLNMTGVAAVGPIQSVYVNNTRCGSPIDIIAQDTGMAVTVPAFSSGMFPFVSLTQQIIVSGRYDVGASVSAPWTSNADETACVFYNFPNPASTAVPAEQYANIYSATVPLTGSVSNQVIPAGLTGSLIFARLIAVNLVGAASGGCNWSPLRLIDGNGNVFGTAPLGVNENGAIPYAELIVLPAGSQKRVINGATLTGTLSGTAPLSGTLGFTAQLTIF